MKRKLGARRGSMMTTALAVTALALVAGTASGRDLPKFADVSKDLTKVVTVTDGSPLWELHKNDKTGKLLAVLPGNYQGRLHMIACTVSGGDAQAGVMGPTFYVEPRRVNDTIMFVQPNLNVRTSGDAQAKASVEELYTGRVLFSAPIVAMQGSRPVIDLGAIATRNARDIFGSSVFGGYGPSVRGINPSLAKLTKAKAFPENVLIEYEAPNAQGTLVRLAYSIGGLEGTRGFKPRAADPRVGYFYDWHRDYAKPSNEDVTERYISRWHIEKADPSLRVSPPKEPIVWYIEHTTPIRYRRYVREGIEMWNDAFEGIGIVGALEVRQQDAATGAYMDLDPEDARYNFFRWNTSGQGYAIGPSRTNPKTGEILDADVVWHQGLTRSVRSMYANLANDIVDQSFGPESLAWFAEHPEWDPRVRLAPIGLGTPPVPGTMTHPGGHEIGDHEDRWALGMPMHTAGSCNIGEMLSYDFALADIVIAAGLFSTMDDHEHADMLDGLPEDFVGGMIRYISAHEVGHCIGLQHNMIASTIRTLEEINTEGFEGPTVGSVMEYAAVNINHELGEVQGPYATPELGPYDHWAVAFGYGDKKDVDDVLSRVAEPDNIWLPQMAIGFTADPRNVTWDLGADNLNFAESRLSLINDLRSKLVDEIVDDGESWAVARRRYQSMMGTHLQALSIASGWIGGSFVSNDFKGDPNGRMPVEDVPVGQQRRAMNLIIANSFEDDALGLTPELVRAFGKEHWWDPSGTGELVQDGSFTVHDTVSGVQATALSFLMSPTRLRRVYDNEFRTDGDQFTLAELLTTVTDAAWSEVESGSNEISSFRRNLQTEHLNRLVTLALLDRNTSPAVHTISTLAVAELERIDGWAEASSRRARDAYTTAHLGDVRKTIEQAMNVAYTIDR